MKTITIQGNSYIELDLNIPVILNGLHYKSLKDSFERYKESYERDGSVYEGNIEDFASLCAVAAMNTNLTKYADILCR